MSDVTQFTQVNRGMAKNVRNILDKELSSILEPYGLNFELGNCTYDPDEGWLKFREVRLAVALNGERPLTAKQQALQNEGVEVPLSMIDSLRDINQQLWEAEDVIRLKEKRQEFDDEFIHCARHDAILNDQRFLIKNKINNHCDSFIKEQKSYEGLYTSN